MLSGKSQLFKYCIKYDNEKTAIMYANGRKGMLYRGKGCKIVNIPAVYANTNIGAKSILALNANLL